VGRWRSVLDAVLSGDRDASIAFDDLCGLLVRLGFERRVRGSHNVFRGRGIPEKPNLQRDGQHAKPYQVRQVRGIIRKHGLGGDL